MKLPVPLKPAVDDNCAREKRKLRNSTALMLISLLRSAKLRLNEKP